jgi:outer membrane autotransporter protein
MKKPFRSLLLSTAIALPCLTPMSSAGFDTTTTTGTGLWSSTEQWDGNPVTGVPPEEGDLVAFAGYNGSNGTSTNDVVDSVEGLVFVDSAAGSYLVGGNAVTINATGITNNSTLSQTVALDLTLVANQTWTAAGGNLTVTGNVTNAGYALTADANQTISIDGTMSGNGNLVKNGNGTLRLSGNNTAYTGATYINNGTILLGNVNGLNTPSTNATIYFDGGTLTYAPGVVVDLSARFFYEGNASSNIDTPAGTNQTYTSPVNAASLNKEGDGTITLTAGNSYNGSTTISAGTLQIGGNGSLGANNGNNYTAPIVNNGTFVFASSVQQTLSGNMTGNGNLTVDATGSLTTTGDVQTANTQVVNGLLSVDGNLTSTTFTVDAGGTLGGTGFVNAPVVVSGFLNAGRSPGTQTYASIAMNPGAVMVVEIASISNFDRYIVNGAAVLDGTLSAVPYGGNSFAYGQRYDFLFASSITGEFDSITTPEAFRARFLNSGTVGTLLLAPDTYTRVAITPNQKNAAKALDSYIPATSGDRQTVSIALDSLTAQQYPAAFDQIAPGFYESLANIAIEQTYTQAQLLNQRISSVRLGAKGFQAIGLSQPIKYDKDGKSVADAKTASPIVEKSFNTNWNAWALGNGEFSRSQGYSGAPNYNNNGGGFLAGADYSFGGGLVAGLFAGYQYSYASYNGGGSAQGNSVLFGGYAGYANEAGYYVDGIVSGGYTGFQTRRSIEFGTIDRTANADPNSGQFSAALNLGKDFEWSNFTLGPIAGVQYTYVGIGGFTESGADSLDLAIDQQNANSFRSNLGARIAYTWAASQNLKFIPEVRGFWMHEFLNDSRNIGAALDGGSGANFDYATGDPYFNSVFGGAGVSTQIGENITGSLFYNVNFGSENFLNNIISAGLNVSF